MKSILFRSIGVSLFLLCLTLSGFADGEMGAGSKTGNGGGLAPDTTIQINPKTVDEVNTDETDFFGWLAKFFTDVLS